MVVGVALGLGAALVLGAASAAPVLALATGLVQAAVVARWHPALRVPGGREGAVVAMAAAVAADLLVLTTDDVHPMGPAAAVGGVAVVAALGAQLVRRDGRPEVTVSLAATVTLAALVVLAAGDVAAAPADQGELRGAPPAAGGPPPGAAPRAPGPAGAGAGRAATVAAAAGLPGRPGLGRVPGRVLGWVLGAADAVAVGVAVLVVGGATARTAAVVPVAVTAVATLGRLVAERLPRPDP